MLWNYNKNIQNLLLQVDSEVCLAVLEFESFSIESVLFSNKHWLLVHKCFS